MSYTKISSLILYVVAAISLVVILFFYAGPKTISFDVDDRVEQLLSEGAIAETPDAEPAVADSLAQDSTAVDTTALAEETAMPEDTTQAAAAVTEAETEVAEVLPAEIDLRDHLSGWEYMVYKRTDYALGWAYILFIVAAIAAVLFPLITTVTNPKSIMRLLAVLAGAAVLLVVAYFVLASDTPIDILGYTGTDNKDPGTLKWIGTGLYSTYIIFGIALLSILYSEIANLFK